MVQLRVQCQVIATARHVLANQDLRVHAQHSCTLEMCVAASSEMNVSRAGTALCQHALTKSLCYCSWMQQRPAGSRFLSHCWQSPSRPCVMALRKARCTQRLLHCLNAQTGLALCMAHQYARADREVDKPILTMEGPVLLRAKGTQSVGMSGLRKSCL